MKGTRLERPDVEDLERASSGMNSVAETWSQPDSEDLEDSVCVESSSLPDASLMFSQQKARGKKNEELALGIQHGNSKEQVVLENRG